MKKRKICISMSLVAIVLLAVIAVGAQPNYDQGILLQTVQPGDYVPGEAIVGFYGPLPYFYQNITEKVRNKYSLEIKATIDELCMVVYSNVDDATFALLQRDPDVKFVERNHIGEWLAIPNDTYWDLQWGPQRIDAPGAWELTTGSSDVRVAVIDSGIDVTHPDLGNYVTGWDWEYDDPVPNDELGHGTHCAGIIGATGNNDEGIAGIAWNVGLISEKVGTYPPLYEDLVIQGIVHAVNNGADIISMSFRLPDSDALEQAILFAYNQGCLLVAASGNLDTSPVDYPARYPEVIAVGAIDQNDALASFSNFGPNQELVAPGVDIYSTSPPDGYEYSSGTSMACPHVAGVAALMLSLNPDLTSEEIRCILQTTAEDLGAAGWDGYYGHGLVDAYEAVSAADFRYSIEVTPTSQVITVPDPGFVEFEVKVSLIQGTPQTVTLDLDSYYLPSPNAYTYSFSQSSGPPPFTSTLTVYASEPQLPKILRVVGSSESAGCDVIRYSNFFTVRTDPVPPADLVWIKTSEEDNGITLDPRLGDVWTSPWIWSYPDPPHIGEPNNLYVTVGNIGNTDSGPVLVKPYFNEYPWTIPVKDWPSLETKTIPNILAGESVDVCWDNWVLPSGWKEHFCVFAQAWRPGYEDFDETFDIQVYNNIAQKNFIGVFTGSAYKTILTFENPTAKPMEITVYMEAPDNDWTVDLCMPSDKKERVINTPLIIPPKQQKDLELTINPGIEGEGDVNIRYTIKGYEEIYPDLFRFTFHVKRCGEEPDEEKKYLTGVYSTFNLYHDVVEMYVRAINDDYSNVIYDLEIFREDQYPMWDSIEVLETPEGWSFEDFGCGVKFFTETNPLIKCQRVRFVFRVTAKRISWYIRIHVTDKNHQNMGMIVGTRWWLYYYPV